MEPRLAGLPFAAMHQGVGIALQVLAVEARFAAVARRARFDA